MRVPTSHKLQGRQQGACSQSAKAQAPRTEKYFPQFAGQASPRLKSNAAAVRRQGRGHSPATRGRRARLELGALRLHRRLVLVVFGVVLHPRHDGTALHQVRDLGWFTAETSMCTDRHHSRPAGVAPVPQVLWNQAPKHTASAAVCGGLHLPGGRVHLL